MATLVGTQADIKGALNSMLELEYDALEAYGAAIARLQNAEYKSKLQAFVRDHERHVADLNSSLRSMNVVPASKADLKGVLAKGKVVIGALGGDGAILRAMKSNEDDTNVAYEKIVSRPDLPTSLVDIMRRNLDDERRHRAWIEQTLSTVQTQRTGTASHPGR